MQLLEGLAYAHARAILHRDIKAANILIMANGDLKIADWGLGVQNIDVSKLDINEIIKTAKAGSGEGTSIFMAPEIAKINRYIYDMNLKNAIAARKGEKVQEIITELYDTRVDSFSAGTMFYLLLTGGVPEFFLRNTLKIKWAEDPKAEINPLDAKKWSKELNEFVMALM